MKTQFPKNGLTLDKNSINYSQIQYNQHSQSITEKSMKESHFIGTLMPSHPDFQPIIQEIREKYSLPEISPDDDPITEIYLDGVSARYQRAVKKPILQPVKNYQICWLIL
jgi:hypothetical protein